MWTRSDFRTDDKFSLGASGHRGVSDSRGRFNFVDVSPGGFYTSQAIEIVRFRFPNEIR